MMDMARSAKGDQGRRSGRETAYDVGFEVLCKLGSRASDALPQLRDWLERADDIAPRTNRQMLINALSRMGASRDDVRSILRVNASDQKALSNFDESWQRSRGARTCE